MEEDINILKTVLKADEAMFEDVGTHWYLDEISINAIKNLINKYKELEKRIEFMKQAHAKELEWDFRTIDKLKGDYVLHKKIIELMAEYISGTDIDEDVCKKVGQSPFCDEYETDSNCRECVIEFFRKKAKGE